MTHQHRIKQHRIELANHRVGLSQCVDSDFVAGLRTHLPRLHDELLSEFGHQSLVDQKTMDPRICKNLFCLDDEA
jgi:hypothetical protein